MTKTIYDNTNLAESYAGVTTPLTFSFVRSVYANAYRHFSRMMGVSERTIASEHEMYEHMIAMIGGRLYYRLDLWYRLVSLLPFYRFNKGFFERMLGVPADHETAGKENLWRYFPRTLLQFCVIATSFLFMGRSIRQFLARFRRRYEQHACEDLSSLTLKELKTLYERLRDELVGEWRVPIANDFAVMVSTGLLGAVGHGMDESVIYGALVQDTRMPLISLDPGRKIHAITREILKHSSLVRTCKSQLDDASVLRLLSQTPKYAPIQRMIKAYIDEFGSRAPNELKLEAQSFTERPESIIALLRSSLSTGTARLSATRVSLPASLSLPRRVAFRILLGWARASIARREETRLCRSLIFGLARRIFLAAGERLKEQKRVAVSRDVFLLTVDEIFGDSDRASFTGEIEKRRSSFAIFKACDLPSRIESEDDVLSIEQTLCTPDKKRATDPIRDISLKGRVASTGGSQTIEGVSLVLPEFDPNAAFHGKILITTHTDPGWTLVFPLISGIIVERGGMLSHAAIVARELGIPCIVGVSGVMCSISDGESVTMDLSSGDIRTK